MADIQERAEHAWRMYSVDIATENRQPSEHELYITGYMAGVAQTQRDYSVHYSRD